MMKAVVLVVCFTINVALAYYVGYKHGDIDARIAMIDRTLKAIEIKVGDAE